MIDLKTMGVYLFANEGSIHFLGRTVLLRPVLLAGCTGKPKRREQDQASLRRRGHGVQLGTAEV